MKIEICDIYLELQTNIKLMLIKHQYLITEIILEYI